MSLWSFLPRRYPVLEARTLRDEYLRADPSFTQLHLLDTLVAMVEEAAQMLSAKAFRLRLAIASLVFGIGFMAASMLYE